MGFTSMKILVLSTGLTRFWRAKGPKLKAEPGLKQSRGTEQTTIHLEWKGSIQPPPTVDGQVNKMNKTGDK